jgi:hypothetical protein
MGATHTWVVVLQICASWHVALVKQQPAIGVCPHDVGSTDVVSHTLFGTQVVQVPDRHASPGWHVELMAQHPIVGVYVHV